MMKGYQKVFLFIFSLLIPSAICFAYPRFGVNISIPLYAKEPPHLQGFQFMLTYDPDCLYWRQISLLFDGGFSHFWDHGEPYYTTLNIYSIAPIVRYHFNREPGFHPCHLFHPYLDFSIGLAYLNHTHFENRKLGIHFAFQDRMGVGTFIGYSESFSIGLHAVHYSNARLSGHNSGVTIPLMLDLGYRF